METAWRARPRPRALRPTIDPPSLRSRAGARPEDVAAAFTALLDGHVEVVDNFYNERIEEGVIILHALHQHGEKIVRAARAPPPRLGRLPSTASTRDPPSRRLTAV